MDHDRLFKELLTTFFADFLRLFLPELGGYVDFASFEFLDKEVFTDVTAGERHEADLIVKARFQGSEAFFLVHVENQAKAQADFGRRMFRYFARLYEAHDLPVYPVVPSPTTRLSGKSRRSTGLLFRIAPCWTSGSA